MTEQLTEIDFISFCPVQQCEHKHKSNRWTHNSCGGRLKLNNKGMLRCLKYGATGAFESTFFLGRRDYEVSSAQGIALALGYMAGLKESSPQGFIAEATKAIFQRVSDGWSGERLELDEESIDSHKEECNEPPFQKVEEPPEKDENDDTDQHKHIDELLEETL